MVSFKYRTDNNYKELIGWGAIRVGHPEGTVKAHIEELMKNLELINHMIPQRHIEKLVFLIELHDSFKRDSMHGVPIHDENSHSSLAASYARGFTDEYFLIRTIRDHDVPYAAYKKNNITRARDTLLGLDADEKAIFILFNIIDNVTVGKDLKPLVWFLNTIDIPEQYITDCFHYLVSEK